MCVLPAFSFTILIADFYAKSWSLYADVSMLPSKLSSFYSDTILWVCPL